MPFAKSYLVILTIPFFQVQLFPKIFTLNPSQQPKWPFIINALYTKPLLQVSLFNISQNLTIEDFNKIRVQQKMTNNFKTRRETSCSTFVTKT